MAPGELHAKFKLSISDEALREAGWVPASSTDLERRASADDLQVIGFPLAAMALVAGLTTSRGHTFALVAGVTAGGATALVQRSSAGSQTLKRVAAFLRPRT